THGTIPTRKHYIRFKKRFAIHAFTVGSIRKACATLNSTYKSGIKDIYRHYKYREIYWGSKHYEIGYMTYNLVSKYQQMVEIYNLVVKFYASRNHTRYATTYYLLYLYSCMVTFQKTIVYMTESLHELDSRYKDDQRDGRNAFDTSDDDDKNHDKDDDPYDDDMHNTGLPSDVDLINNPTEPDWKKDEEKKREEERERNRNNDSWLFNWSIPTRTTPKRGRWPLDRYGWDVELYEGQVFG
ncbi:uncharacterized protein LOC113238879, partial [Hyposmocoma kahamanoa]|uniref:uncharacterized protein LOC113238879 n=1 Tax=Hyposmocoma kahamanoa TaxID=1477025 RepID=UPI000E6D9BFD